MIREYITPDFDVTVYEIDDVITVSVITGDPDTGNPGEEWYG